MAHEADTTSPERLLAQVEWVRRLAAALVGRGDADEVVQQTYLQALSSPPRAVANLRGWLTTVVRNVARYRVRVEGRRATHERHAAELAPAPDPAESVARAELHRRVVDAVLALDEPYRSTLLMRFFDDLSADAIARARSLPVETVRTRVKRGLAMLRERLAGDRDAAASALLFAQLARFAQHGDGSAAASTAAAAGTLAAGGVVMSLFAKCAVAAAVVAAAAAVTWIARRGEPVRSQSAASATASNAAAASSGAPEPAAPTRVAAESAKAVAANQPESSSPSTPTPDAPTIHGIVLDDFGRAVADAQVWIVPETNETHRTPSEASRRATTEKSGAAALAGAPHDDTLRMKTGADGRFVSEPLAGHAFWSVLAFHPDLGGGAGEMLRVETLTPDSVETVTLVRAVRLHGTVRDPDGKLLGGAKIWIAGRESRVTTFSTEYESGSDGPALGTWSTEPLYARHFDIVARLDGFEPPKEYRKVEVAPGQTDVNVDLVLQPTEDVLVSGPIVDSSGGAYDLREMIDAFAVAIPDRRRHPDAPNVVALYALPSPTPMPAIGDAFPDAERPGRIDATNAKYEIRLSRSFSGTLVLTVGRRVAGTAECRDVRAPPPLQVDPTLLDEAPPIATLAVRLVDATSGEALSPSGIDLYVSHFDRFDYWRKSRTPADDPFVREFTVPLGRAMVMALRAGYVADAPMVELTRAGERREVTIALAKADASIRGRIVDEAGKPKQGLRLRLYRQSASGFDSVGVEIPPTDENGVFAIGPLAHVDYMVVADLWEHAPLVRRVRAETSPATLDLVATPAERIDLHWSRPADRAGGDVMWRILDAEGVPVVDAWTASAQMATQDDAVASFLPAGHYRAFIACQDCREGIVEFDAPAAAPIEIRLERAR